MKFKVGDRVRVIGVYKAKPISTSHNYTGKCGVIRSIVSAGLSPYNIEVQLDNYEYCTEYLHPNELAHENNQLYQVGDTVKYPKGSIHYKVDEVLCNGNLWLVNPRTGRRYLHKATHQLCKVSPARPAVDINKNLKEKENETMRGRNAVELWYKREMEANSANLFDVEAKFRAKSEKATIIKPVVKAIETANKALEEANRPTLPTLSLEGTKLNKVETKELKAKLAKADKSESIRAKYDEVLASLGVVGSTGTPDEAFAILRAYGIMSEDNTIA